MAAEQKQPTAAEQRREATDAIEARRDEQAGVVPQPGGAPRPLDEPPADKPTLVACWHCGKLKPAPAFPGRERLETHADLAAPVDEFCPHCGKGALVEGVINGPTAVVMPDGKPLPPAWEPKR